MHEPRSPLIRWVLRGAAASLALAAVARLGGEPPQPRAAPIQLSSMQDRIAVARPLPGMQPGEVSSVMNIREPLRYGQSVWKEAGEPAGPITLRVDRDRQILSVFRAGHEIGTTVILYGAPEKPTPAGRYPVRGKKPLHISNRYGAEMPYTLWLTDDGDHTGRLDGLHGPQHVADHRDPADGVQHLHGLRLHAGAATCGQDDDGEVVHGAQSVTGPGRGPIPVRAVLTAARRRWTSPAHPCAP